MDDVMSTREYERRYGDAKDAGCDRISHSAVPPAGPYNPANIDRDKHGRAYEPCPQPARPGTLQQELDRSIQLAPARTMTDFEMRQKRDQDEAARAAEKEMYLRQRFSSIAGAGEMGATVPTHGFSLALESMKMGRAVGRLGWNGKGMWIAIQKEPRIGYGDYVYIRTVDGTTIPWVASQSDLLANDWIVL